MSRLLMYGIKQQRRKVDLGFEPFVAPADFDRTAQPVDIYAILNAYYKTNSLATYIEYLADATTSYALNYSNSTSWRYGYTSGGVDYIVDIPETETIAPISKGNYTSVTVNSTAGFPATGTIRFHDGGWFVYTGKTDTTFTGISQIINQPSITVVYLNGATATFPTSTTKKWVIFNTHLTTINYIAKKDAITKWVYFSDVNVNFKWCGSYGGTTALMYIHLTNVENILAFDAYTFINFTTLTGVITLPNLTSLPTQLFQGDTSITGPLVIPDNMTTLGGYAVFAGTRITSLDTNNLTTLNTSNANSSWGNFAGCTYLTSLTIGSSLSYIGEGTFKGCSGLTGSLTIPGTVKTIKYQAFNGTNYSGTLTLEEGIEELCGFDGCTALTGTLAIPSSVTVLGDSAFSGCTGFTDVTWYNNITSIGANAFKGCTNWDGTLSLPTEVTTIGNFAFYNCNKLDGTITIPAKLISLGYGVFTLTLFTDIDVTANANFQEEDDVLYDLNTSGQVIANHSLKVNVSTLTFKSTTTKILDYCCYECPRTGTLSLPTSVNYIGSYSFYKASAFTLAALTIPAAVTSIGMWAFGPANRFSSLTLTTPSSLTVINSFAFNNMISVTGTLVIPNSVVTIGEASLPTGITGIVFEATSSLTTLGNAFYGCNHLTGTLDLPASLTLLNAPAGNTFVGCNFTAITSSSSNYPAEDNVLYDVRTVGQIKAYHAAKGYAGTLTLKTGTTSINNSAFLNNTLRTGTLSILNTITSIGAAAFSGCSGFTQCNSYRSTAPTVGANGLLLGGTARALHIPTGGGTGYGVAPWTTATIFTQPAIADL